jgi:HSP20 family molecular chaperone IbpA
MAFLPRNFYNSTNDTSFTPLFRLLDDFDNYSRQSDTHTGGRRSGLPNWLPKFDMRETREAYELHGELPGIMKENVNIEFTEPQVMIIRGKVERSYSVGKPPAGHLEGTTMSGTITEGGDSDPHKWRQPSTVEDEDETAVAERDEQRVEKPADKAKYWLSERSMGEFSRTFNFPVLVDQDGVTANLKDGILSVLVPKANTHEKHRRITIN